MTADPNSDKSDEMCIYSRKSKEGDGEDTEAGGDGLSYPRLRNLVSIADRSHSHLRTEWTHFSFKDNLKHDGTLTVTLLTLGKLAT